MKRRGYFGAYQQHRFINQKQGDYWDGQENGGDFDSTGELRTYFSVIRCRGYDRIDEDSDWQVTEITYLSPPFIHTDGTIYRYYQFHRLGLTATNVVVSFGIAICEQNGKLSGGQMNQRSIWDVQVGNVNTRYQAYSLINETYNNSDYYDYWTNIQTKPPRFNAVAIDMMIGNQSTAVFNRVQADSYPSTSTYTSLIIHRPSTQLFSEIALEWSLINSTSDIVERARELSNVKYWYGGKGQVMTIQLANSLRSANSGVWTESYYRQAIAKIDGVSRCGDCSYLVCYAYNVAQIGTSQIRQQYSIYNGTPLPGMILWRSGHVAITDGDYAIQLRGIDYDYVEIPVTMDNYTYTLYDPTISY